MSRGIAFLMYHELQLPGGELCDESAGYRRYAVSQDNFKNQLVMMESNGWRGWNVSQALEVMNAEHETERGLCITFDDGCATDLSTAAPLLLEKEFNATFYITVNHLGKRGYLTNTALQELASLGVEIGSHSMSHRYLNDLDLSGLTFELGESKKKLEDIAGVEVKHFSCPGGRVDGQVEQIAREVGYDSVVTSRIGLNTRTTNRYGLARIAVKENTSTAALTKLCQGQGIFLSQAQNAALSAAKRVLGNSFYERVRGAALSHK